MTTLRIVIADDQGIVLGGLRMILEDLMLEMMYNLPAQRKLRDFVVTAEMVKGREINWSLLEKAG